MESLGIQPIPFLLQALNFLILLLVLKKFLYKPILQMLAERKKKIEEGVEFSEKTKAEIENYPKSKLDKTNKKTKKAAKKQEAEIVDEANVQAQEINARARRDSEALKEELEKELKVKAVEIAEKIVEKVIKESLSESAHKALIDRKLKDVSGKLKA